MEALADIVQRSDVAAFLWVHARTGARPVDAIMYAASVVGLGSVLIPLAATLLALLDRRIFWRRAIALAIITLLAGGLGQIVKHWAQRPRPVRALAAILDDGRAVRTPLFRVGERTWFPFVEGRAPEGFPRGGIQVLGPVLGKRSFPSGHAINGFATATCLFYFLRRKAWLFFSVAALIGASRVYNGVHFPSDVVVGAAVGALFAWGAVVFVERFTPLLFFLPAHARKRRDRPARVMIVAGEASADLYAARLARELIAQSPGAEVFGVGGPRLREAGGTILHDANELSLMGFTDVLRALRRIRRIFLSLSARLVREPPDALVCIDLPDFNLILARRAKDLGVPVCYYISPQVWAWRTRRVKKIARRVDRMIVAFPFEKALFEKAGVDTRYEGHPLVEVARPTTGPEETRRRLNLDPARPVVALLPGSRTNEIAHLLEPLLGAAEILAGEFPSLQFALAVAPGRSAAEFAPRLAGRRVPVVLAEGPVYDLFQIARLGLVTSGTATLEAALFTLPMVIVYRGSRVNVTVARRLVKVPFIGLPNLIAGRAIVPELIQDQATPARIAAEARRLLSDPAEYERMRRDLAAVRNALAGEGTSARVARIVLDLIAERAREAA